MQRVIQVGDKTYHLVGQKFVNPLRREALTEARERYRALHGNDVVEIKGRDGLVGFYARIEYKPL